MTTIHRPRQGSRAIQPRKKSEVDTENVFNISNYIRVLLSASLASTILYYIGYSYFISFCQKLALQPKCLGFNTLRFSNEILSIFILVLIFSSVLTFLYCLMKHIKLKMDHLRYGWDIASRECEHERVPAKLVFFYFYLLSFGLVVTYFIIIRLILPLFSLYIFYMISIYVIDNFMSFSAIIFFLVLSMLVIMVSRNPIVAPILRDEILELDKITKSMPSFIEKCLIIFSILTLVSIFPH